jgi:Toxin with a conserved tryptophan and TIP tripeptide motif
VAVNEDDPPRARAGLGCTRPRGGNQHAEEIDNLWQALANCQALFVAKCKCEAPPVFPVRSPNNWRASNFDRNTATKIVVGAGGAYIVYRILRMIPSLAPPPWPTIPATPQFLEPRET